MTMNAQRTKPALLGRTVLNKVPEVTIYFWVIKVLSTTVGETAADYLNLNLHLGLPGTTYIMSTLLLAALLLQLRTTRYIAWIYWPTVVLISIVGTLITDNLTDGLDVPLEATTAIFAIALLATFAAWYGTERTLSIHTVHTTRREACYWLAILFTFALGTAAGDLAAEQLGLAYGTSAVIFAALIALVALARFGFKLNAVLAFWIAYVLTRPLGASLGDLTSQPVDEGGLGFGATATSLLFLIIIVGLVGYLTITKTDETPGIERYRDGQASA
jgi:uncharacterized membrane-anchored protein